VTVKLVKTYYDYNADITIELRSERLGKPPSLAAVSGLGEV